MSLITSKVALGYYGHEHLDYNEHALETMDAAHRKLKKGGKLWFVADGLMQKKMKQLLSEAGFEQSKITARRLTEAERQQTYWTREYKGFLYVFKAVK